ALDAEMQTNLAGLYVLYVEDDALVRKSTQELLYGCGLVVDAVESVEELERLLPTLERQPDVLITDYRLLGERNAVDVIANVRSQLAVDVATIVLTGETTSFPAVAALGDAKVLRKPVSPGTLLGEISTVCRRDQPSRASAQ